jgi:tRNA(Ile2) C34 agmatinyltransferase TiaS
LIEEWTDETVPCRDSSCPGRAEPDGDGELRFHVCPVCGYEFGYQRPETVEVKDSCSLGVPVEVRKAASAPMGRVLADDARQAALPVLQIGRRRPE